MRVKCKTFVEYEGEFVFIEIGSLNELVQASRKTHFNFTDEKGKIESIEKGDFEFIEIIDDAAYNRAISVAVKHSSGGYQTCDIIGQAFSRTPSQVAADLRTERATQ